MEDLEYEDFDRYLLRQNGKIIHQIWFGIIPNRDAASEALEGLKKYRDTWITQNPNWMYNCWNLDRCENLIKLYYPHHLAMYRRYLYPIQRCDAVRYFILHRYGGLYADMDYHCNRSWDEVLEQYPNSLYLVETPNTTYFTNHSDVHISNSLMYSESGHIFWSSLFIELELYQRAPMYYSRHMTIMFTTGPGILNRAYNRYKLRYKLYHYPSKFFHPYGLSTDIVTLNKHQAVFATHLGKGSWEATDSRLLIFLYQEGYMLAIIIAVLVLPSLTYWLARKSHRLK